MKCPSILAHLPGVMSFVHVLVDASVMGKSMDPVNKTICEEDEGHNRHTDEPPA